MCHARARALDGRSAARVTSAHSARCAAHRATINFGDAHMFDLYSEQTDLLPQPPRRG
jgi:hypothetical protein